MRLVLFAMALLALTACVNVRGSDALSDEGLAAQWQPAVSGKGAIHELYGQPHAVSRNQDGQAQWHYYQVQDRLKYTSFLPYVGFFVGGFDVDWTERSFAFSEDGSVVSSDTRTNMKYKNNLAWTGDVLTRSYQVRAVREEMVAEGLPFDNDLARQMAAVVDRYVE